MNEGKIFLSFLIVFLFVLPAALYSQPLFQSFEMISNGNGVIPVVAGFDVTTQPAGAQYGAYSADWYRDYLQSSNDPPSIAELPNGMQQARGWYFVVAGGPGVTDHEWAVDRWTRGGANYALITENSYEIRFTEAGGMAVMQYTTRSVVDVPFELWFLDNTPGDASDDVRMIPYLYDADGTDYFSFALDHQADDGDDDPYSDFIYFRMPVDESPGDAGYHKAFPCCDYVVNYDEVGAEHIARVVLMNWNRHQGETTPGAGDGPVNVSPEYGTTFRISTNDIIGPEWDVTYVNGGPPISYEVAVQDGGSGLATINVLQANNATVSVESFSPGTNEPVIITITKIDQGLVEFGVILEATDTGGNSSQFSHEIDSPIHNAGNTILLLQPNSNLGTYYSPLSGAAGASGYWPRIGGVDHLFNGNLWVGTVVNGDVRVTYNLDGGSLPLEWTQTSGSEITLGTVISDQDIGMTYDDQFASFTPIGLRVHQQSFQ